MKKLFCTLLLSLTAFSAQAETTPKVTAEEAVYEFAQNILTALRTKDEQTSASDAIKGELDAIISYPVIAKSVMGDYYKQANQKQLKTFIIVFRKSLIDTFAQGFEIFQDYEVKLSEQQDENGSLTNTQVYLDVISPEGEVYKIVQTMYYSPDKQKWRMLNAVLNGVNLGIIFRNQYKQLITEAEGNLDLTNKLWLEQMKKEYEKQLELFEETPYEGTK